VIDVLVIDRTDEGAQASVRLLVTDTLMPDREAARRLARVVLETA